jgi:transposase InsO family protein
MGSSGTSLNENWFIGIEDASREIEAWRLDYNWERPHSALGNRASQEFALRAKAAWRPPEERFFHPGGMSV